MRGLLPCCAVTAVDKWQREQLPRLTAQMIERVRRMPELLESIHPTGPGHLGFAERGILGLVNQDRLRRILTRMLDENEFLSAYGIRSLSRPSRRSSLCVYDGRAGVPGELPALGIG